MTQEFEETLAFYKNLPFTIGGTPKKQVPHKANLDMIDAELVSFYSERYVDVDADEILINEHRERLYGLCNLVQPGEFYLDVGCASGGHMEVLHQRGINGIGLDLSVANIVRGREKYPHLEFVHGFAEAIPFKDNYFDIAILGDVIEHFRNPRVSLAECLRVVRKGICLCIPVNGEATAEHISPLSYEKIRDLLQFFMLDWRLFDFDGREIAKPSRKAKLATFPWAIIRAEKTDGTEAVFREVLAADGLDEHKRTVDEILSDDEWRYNTEHQRDETHRNRFKLLSHLIEGQNVLEIACGNGDLAIEVAKVGFDIVGVDISAPGVNQATDLAKKENLDAKARFMVMDATSLEFPDNSFDSVLIPEVLEHFKDSRKILKEAVRVVRNGGRIIVSVPDGLRVPYVGHLRVFFKDTLLTELGQYAAEVIWHELPFKKWLVCSFFVKKKGTVLADGPAIDILMPTYNGRKTIGRAIKSVVNQTYQNWNLIIVNDGGEDIKDIIDGFKDKRIRYIQSEHKGKSHALNVGIANSQGEYIGYLDDDDVLYPVHFEVLVKAALEQKKDFVYTDWYDVTLGENNKETSRGFSHRHDVTPWMLINQNYINHKCILHARSLLEEAGKYDEQLDMLIDWDMIRRLSFISPPNHLWTVTSEHILYYHGGVLQNRITSLWTRDQDKARRSLERITKKTMELVATTEELKNAITYAMLHRGYYYSLEFDSAIWGKNSEIAELNTTLQVKDTQMAALNDALRAKNTQMAALNDALRAKNTQIVELNTTLQAKDYQINGLEVQIQQMQRGVAMQLLRRYHKVVEKVLRTGTHRRYLYELLVKGIRVILNEGLRGFRLKFRRWFRRQVGKQGSIVINEEVRRYQQRILQKEPKPEELEEQKRESRSFRYRPKISIITPVWNTKPEWLKLAIESVINQTYDNFELCLADGNSTKPSVKQTLREYAKKDPRIKVIFLPQNKGTAGNSNEALSLASGEFVGFLDHDDELQPYALYEVVKLLNDKSAADFVYSDEVLVDEQGEPISYQYRPDFSLDYLLSHPYIVHLVVIRKKLIDDVKGFREEFITSHDYDLFLRVISKTRRVFHIPKVLYRWRTYKSSAGFKYQDRVMEFSKKALADFLDREGIDGNIYDGKHFNFFRVQRKILDNPKVSIIIPTRDKVDVLRKCIESIEAKTSYKNYEVIIVDNLSRDAETVEYLNDLSKHYTNYRVLKFEEDFNFSRINNFAAGHARGEHLLFLNNDIEVISSEWLEAMLEHSQRKEVACVGARLLYPNGNIQHVGVVIGLFQCCEHVYKFLNAKDDIGYMGHFISIRNWSAVTAACMMIKSKIFNELHGFEERMKVGFGDTDLCLRAIEKGYLNVYTPYAELYHYESVTRGNTLGKPYGFDPHPEDSQYFKQRWLKIIQNGDPYYNRNLPLDALDVTSYVQIGKLSKYTQVEETPPKSTPASKAKKDEQLVLPHELDTLSGAGDNREIGLEFFGYLKDFCVLKPTGMVLDVGCGVGRIAIPLTKYLERTGRYEGFDTLEEGIKWCKKNISSRYPNFYFQWVNIYNKMYNINGKIIASDFKFPFKDETFDVVFLVSVFTHMIPEDVAHYFSEIHRVLRHKGRCLITSFLLNNESLNFIKQGKSKMDFKYGEGISKWNDQEIPENAIAYQEEYIRTLCNEIGLNIVETPHYGSWCGREQFLSYEDIIIVEKL